MEEWLEFCEKISVTIRIENLWRFFLTYEQFMATVRKLKEKLLKRDN